jgi:hypothetical protein
MTQTGRPIPTYEQFWPYYVREHANPICRALHFTGTTLFLLALVAGFVISPWWFAAAPFTGYLFAWIGHFVFEKNRPATFTYPLWSLRADFRMYACTWTGRMGREIRAAQVT